MGIAETAQLHQEWQGRGAELGRNRLGRSAVRGLGEEKANGRFGAPPPPP